MAENNNLCSLKKICCLSIFANGGTEIVAEEKKNGSIEKPGVKNGTPRSVVPESAAEKLLQMASLAGKSPDSIVVGLGRIPFGRRGCIRPPLQHEIETGGVVAFRDKNILPVCGGG